MFSEIVGHHNIRVNFLNTVGKPGAFIFHGPPSVGKRTIAFEIAKKDLCVEGRLDNCSCRSCKIFKGDHPDFLFLGGRGKILVEDIDKLIGFTLRSSLLSPTKVIVVDNIDKASIEASNRILKILEESKYSFFLISANYYNVLSTIRSRCISTKFDNLSSEDISNILFKKMGFDLPSSRVLGWVGASCSVDIFANAGSYLKHRELACEFIQNIKDILSSLDFIEKIEDTGIFSDMLILVLTDILFLKNGISDIINADKRDLLQKVSKGLNDKALVSSLGLLTQIKKNLNLNLDLSFVLKRMLIKIHPIISL